MEEYKKEYYQRNKERILEYQKEYNKENYEKIKLYQKNYQKDLKKKKVPCPYCHKYLTKSYLDYHIFKIH